MAAQALFLTGITLCRVLGRETPQIVTSMPQEAPVRTVPGKAQQREVLQDVTYLNRYIFAWNALHPMGGGVEHWVVSFCPRWWEPCQHLEPIFSEAAKRWQGQLNRDPSVVRVRFAQVDCAVDKVLCNEQRVTSYPMVAIYHSGMQVGVTGITREMATDLEEFLKKELEVAPKTISTEAPGDFKAKPLGHARPLWPLDMQEFKEFCAFCWHSSCDLFLAAVLVLVSLRFLHVSPQDARGDVSTRTTGHSSFDFLPWAPVPTAVEI